VGYGLLHHGRYLVVFLGRHLEGGLQAHYVRCCPASLKLLELPSLLLDGCWRPRSPQTSARDSTTPSRKCSAQSRETGADAKNKNAAIPLLWLKQKRSIVSMCCIQSNLVGLRLVLHAPRSCTREPLKPAGLQRSLDDAENDVHKARDKIACTKPPCSVM